MSAATAPWAEATPDAFALADDRAVLTWAELDGLLDRATNGLLAEGLAPGARVAVFAHNAVETAVAYLAALQAGISSVPVNFHLTAGEAAYILEDSDTALVFVGPETAETGLAAAAAAGVERVIGWRCPPQPRLTGFETWLAPAGAAPPRDNLQPLPHLHYTSGTTGRPKGAESPPSNFTRAATVKDFFADLAARLRPLDDWSPALAVGPLYHSAPLRAVRHLGAGVALRILSRFDPERVLQAIESDGIRTATMVPTHFQRLLALPAAVRRKYDLSSLRSVRHTGAACPVEVKRAMIDWFGPVIFEGYGATESGTLASIESHEWLRKPGSVGRPVKPYELVVVGEDGARLGPNAVGRLYFRDPTGRGVVFHNDPAKTLAAHLEPGVFTLGEIGYADEDGYVFITDRASDMIVSGAVNIYPAEIEQVLLRHPGVADAAVVAGPHADLGEEARALVVPRDPAAPPSGEDLAAFCRASLAGYKCPRAFEIVADLGRNPMGKLNKRELRRRFWPGERTIGG